MRKVAAGTKRDFQLFQMKEIRCDRKKFLCSCLERKELAFSPLRRSMVGIAYSREKRVRARLGRQ